MLRSIFLVFLLRVGTCFPCYLHGEFDLDSWFFVLSSPDEYRTEMEELGELLKEKRCEDGISALLLFLQRPGGYERAWYVEKYDAIFFTTHVRHKLFLLSPQCLKYQLTSLNPIANVSEQGIITFEVPRYDSESSDND